MAKHARASKSGLLAAAVFLTSLSLQFLVPTAEPSIASNPGIKAFECDPAFYQFSNGAFYRYNVAPDGGAEPFFEVIGGADGSQKDNNSDVTRTTLLDAGGNDNGKLPEVNGTGYNTADNFFYTTHSSNLYRVGQRVDDSGEAVAELVGAIDTSGNGKFVNVAADFVADDKLLLSAGDDFAILDVNNLDLDDFPISGSWTPADFTAVVNDSGVATSIYGMNSKTLFRLDFGSDGPLSGAALSDSATVQLASGQTARLDEAGGYGSAYSDSNGNLFFYSNNTAEVYRIDSSEREAFEAGTKTSNLTINLVSTASKLLETANDGASCPTATSPFAEPIAVPDIYAFTEGPTFTTQGSSTGLTAGDSAGVDVVVKSITFGGTTIYRGDITDPGTGSESYPANFDTPGNNNATVSDGTTTITVSDWNTGEFSVNGITGGSVQFSYNVIETRKVYGETAPRTSNTATVNIRALTIDDKTVADAKQYLDYDNYSVGTTFTAQGKEADQTYYWRIDPGASNDGLPSGMSINSSTGALQGTPTGTPLGADTDYTFTVEVGLDSAFKTAVSKDFTITVLQPDEFDLSYSNNIVSIPSSETNRTVTGSAPTTSSISQSTVANNPLSMDRYTFDSWNTQSDGNGTEYAEGVTITITADTTLYAIWSEKSFTVSFDGQGNTGGTVPTNRTGHTISVPGNTANLVKFVDGVEFSFQGWSTAPNNGGSSVSGGDTLRPENDLSLYAVWQDESHLVTYFGNNSDDDTQVRAPENKSVLTFPDKGLLTKDGYRFKGWSTEVSGNDTNTYDPDENLLLSGNTNLYAQWELITYTLSFDANEADSGTVPNSITGTSASIPGSNGLQRSGFTFGGWNTQVNGEGTNYTENQTLDLVSLGADETLYAKWVAVIPSPAPNPDPSPTPYLGPIVVDFEPEILTVGEAKRVTVTGSRLQGIYELKLCGIENEIVSTSFDTLEIDVPGLPEVGECDADIKSNSGNLRYLDAVTVIEATSIDEQPETSPAPEIESLPEIVEMTFFPFADGSSAMTSKMYAEIQDFILEHKDRIESITCIGQTEGPTVLRVDIQLSQDRGQAGCDVAAELLDDSVVFEVGSNQVLEVADELRNVRLVLELSPRELSLDSNEEDETARKEENVFGRENY